MCSTSLSTLPLPSFFSIFSPPPSLISILQRELFRQARNAAPCVVIIDEIDALGATRTDGMKRRGESGSGSGRGGKLAVINFYFACTKIWMGLAE
jgi:hypothetical protein